MKAQLEETVDAAVKVELLRDRLVAEDVLRRGEDYLRLTIDTIPVSYLQMAVCWARSRFTGVNRAAQARIINRSSNRSHI